jgi:peptide/nickel transport system substrate-binding protein
MRIGRSVAALGAVVLTVGLAGACSKNTGTDSKPDASRTYHASISTDPKDSVGPAPAVPGASRGGTVHILQEKDYEHLDPQRTYVSNSGIIEQLFTRTLTAFTPSGRNATLVGDLATNAGTDVDGDCKVWRYTIKKGMRYEDGSAITAADVAHGIARSFSPELSEGPHYIQQWLTGKQVYNADYQGPYNGGKALPPNLTVSGSTLTFHFPQPHCDLPYAAAMAETVPVPASRDTGAKYDRHPFSSGPYKIASYERDSKLVLVRNRYWDAKTDPVRHAYPDSVEVDLGASDVEQTNRLVADNGADRTALSTAQVPQSLIPQVQKNDGAMRRSLTGSNGFTFYFAINCERVTDPTIRKAMSYAVDRGAIVQVLGGEKAARPATTLLSPTVAGWQDFDAFPAGAHGNLAKAKKLLNGRHPTLTYAYANSSVNQREAPLIQQMFQRAGFRVVLRPLDATSYNTALGKHPPYDFYQTGWGADWPSGAATIPVLFDGRSIRANGNNDTAYFEQPSVDRRIDELNEMPAAKAGPQWSALEKQMISTYAPVIPLYYQQSFLLHGSKIGGALLSSTGAESFLNLYVKR